MFISRQKAVVTAALSLAVGISPTDARADNSVITSDEQLVYTLHTHLLASSQSLPSSDEFQIAAVCFISDTRACSDGMFGGTGDTDYELNSKERCFKEGYTISDCPEWYKPGGKKCPYGDYYTDCVSICPSSYVSCEEPYYGVGEVCDGKYASCACDPCGSGYDYTTIPSGYVQDGEACLDCDKQTKYKIKINPCDGFYDCGSLGGEAGAATCQSGNTIKYDNCKPCPNLGKYQSCPTGSVCSYEECSGLWYVTDCIGGYQLDSATNTCICDGVDWCAITLSCADLGYKQQSCNGEAIKCPFNSDYSFCRELCFEDFQYSCTEAHETGGRGTTCGGKYAECICETGYMWNDGQCEGDITDCRVGSILYSDKTCSFSGYEAIVGTKTPIGVVVYSDGNGHGQAFALAMQGRLAWGGFGSDVPNLDNILSPYKAARDFASCENTEKIIAAGDASTYPAAWAAHNYTTEGTNAGDWCLPAAGLIVSYLDNEDVIVTNLKKIGKTAFLARNYDIWSSSPRTSDYVWVSDYSSLYGEVSYQGLYQGIKDYTKYVLPVLEF